MDRKLAIYTNGFSILVNRQAGEAVISFAQNQPGFNPESGNMDTAGPIEVASLIMSIELAEKLTDALKDCIEREKNKQ